MRLLQGLQHLEKGFSEGLTHKGSIRQFRALSWIVGALIDRIGFWCVLRLFDKEPKSRIYVTVLASKLSQIYEPPGDS